MWKLLHYIYIYAFSSFCQYVCSLGIEPTTFCAANAMLYYWATQEHLNDKNMYSLNAL